MANRDPHSRTMGAHDRHDEFARSGDTEELREYQSLSIPALISFLLGLASILSLSHIILVAIPLLGVAASLLAIFRMNRTGSTGRTLALAGLALSVFFGAVAVTQYTARQALLNRFAKRAAEQWISLARAGRLREAHQWAMSASLRVGRDELLEAYYDEHLTTKYDMAQMFRRPGLKELSQFGDAVQVRFKNSRNVHDDRNQQVFEFDYVIAHDQNETPLRMRVVRRWNPDYLRHDWIVGPLEDKG